MSRSMPSPAPTVWLVRLNWLWLQKGAVILFLFNASYKRLNLGGPVARGLSSSSPVRKQKSEGKMSSLFVV